MIGKQSSFRNFVIVIVVALIPTGCTSISTIKGLSAQNLRNARAINANMGTLLSISEVSIKYSVNSLWVDANKEIVLALVKKRGDYITPSGDGDAAKIEQEAKDWRDLANAKPEETRQSFIQKSRGNNPLIAAVAFDEGLTANMAAAIVVEVDQIYRHTGLNDEDRFWRAMSTISQFKIIRDSNRARDDVLEAYQFLRGTILEQSANYVEAAEQLDSAARAGASAPNVLKGITENQTVIETIATVVLNRTNDESRANAARDLLRKAGKE